MEISDYKAWYREKLLKAVADKPKANYDDAGVPSYLHSNRVMAWFFWKRIKIALSLVKDYNGKKVLDFGCGAGILFKFLSEKNCMLDACEKNFFELSQAICSELNKEVNIYKDIREIKNKKFDIIFALDVLEHLDDIGEYLKIFASISHNKTLLIICGPTENIFYKIGRYFAGFSGIYHKSNIYDIEKSLVKHNFKQKFIKRMYFPFTLFRISIWMPSDNFI